MGANAGNADEMRPDQQAPDADPGEGGPLPQPDLDSLTESEPDLAVLTSAARAAADAERPFHEAQAVLEDLLHFGPNRALREPAQATGRFGLDNIVGIGIAEKEVGGIPIGILAITVYVITKVPAYLVVPEALVPESINGLPTDVVELGEERELALTGKYRPVKAGVSIGPKPWVDPAGESWVTAGTAGCLLKRGSDIHILSNHHILLNPTGSAVNDPTYQPSLFDGGSASTDQVARLSYWVSLTSGTNYVDCAMARVDDLSLVTPKIACLPGSPGMTPWFTSIPLACSRGMFVRKCGRTTGLTSGVIVSCSYHGSVGGYFYQNQMLIKPWSHTFADNGDSGAVVFWTNDLIRARPVGLLKSVTSAGYGVASRFSAVLSGLGATMAYGLP